MSGTYLAPNVFGVRAQYGAAPVTYAQPTYTVAAPAAYAPTFGAPPAFVPVAAPAQPPAGKLTYFAGKGLAESIRLSFALANQTYEEAFVESKEEWLELQKTLPYGQVPLLEIDGRRLVQSRAITTYICRKYGNYGSHIGEQYEIDEIVDAITSAGVGSPLRAALAKGDGWEAEVAEYLDTKANKLFGQLDRKLEGTNGYFVGGKPSMADIYMFTFNSMWGPFREGMLDAYPNLKKNVEQFGALPQIAAFTNSPKCYPWPPPPEYFPKVVSILY